MTEECPDKKKLAELASGRLPGDVAEELEGHLEQCPACEEAFRELKEDETLALGLRKALGLDEVQRIRGTLQASAGEDYEILEEIGRGASSLVFKARDLSLNKIVAVKCPAQMEERRRQVAVWDEARTMAEVQHPNVAEIYAISDNPELPFMVMEYVDGRPVDEAAEGRPMHEVLELFRQVLSGVKALHKQGIVHRDLKPGNILVDRLGTVKVLDLGIADRTMLSPLLPHAPGGSWGTPAYVAPEQSYEQAPQTSMDVFALGVILFELLTGQRPFQGATARQVVMAIRDADPPLPRALRPVIPGPLQALCLAALEKEPADRYPSAHHFLLDLERFMQGEAVAANPKLLADILEHGVEKHLDDLSRWRKDRLLTHREYDYFADKYDGLLQREDFWVLDSRRISFSQVILHLGAWACIVSALLMLCFHWEELSKGVRISLPLGLFLLLFISGLLLWRQRTRRVALVLLMAASLTWPLFACTALVTMGWFADSSPDQLFKEYMSNQQLLIAAATWVILSLYLWRRTKTAAFSLIAGASILSLASAVFSFMDLRELWMQGEFDVIAGWYLIPGAVVFLAALAVDLRGARAPLAAPLYLMSVIVLFVSLTSVAIFGPTTQWLGLDGAILERGEQIAYSFMLNGALYLAGGLLADRSRTSRLLRRIATLLFWLTPTHILAPLVYFVVKEKWAWSPLPEGWTLSELILPAGALICVFASVPKQMKSFFFSGLFYIAVSVVWLTHRHFLDKFAWPMGLAVCGLILLFVAWRRPGLFAKRKGGGA